MQFRVSFLRFLIASTCKLKAGATEWGNGESDMNTEDSESENMMET